MAPRPRRSRRAITIATLIVMMTPMIDAHVAVATVEGQRAEVERIVDELDRLHEQADILAEDYAVAVDDLSQLEIEIGKAEEKVRAKEAELDQLRGDLSEVAVRTFTGAGADVLGPLFSDTQSYSAGLRRDQYSRVALNVGTGTTDDLDELIRELEEDRKDLEDKRDRAEKLTKEITDKQEQVEQLTAQYVEARSQAETRLGQLIAEEEARRDAEALARMQRQAQQSTGGGGGGGGGNTDGGNTGGGDTGGGNTGGGGDSGGGGGDSGGSGDSGGGTVSVPVSGRAGTAVNAAMGQLGVPYKYATSNPGVSFDCSGLTHYAWGQAGVYLPRNSRAQAAALPHVDPSQAQPGDLVFYYSPISHVGIYLGNGQLVHAPNSGTTVKVANVNWSKVTVVARPG